MSKVTSTALISVAAVVIVVGGLVFRAIGSFEIEVQPSLRGNEPGDLVSVTRIGKYPAVAMQYAVGTVDLDVDVRYGCTLYRIEYITTYHDGTLVEASGLLSIPDSDEFVSAITFLHGTNALRNTAPSSKGLGQGVLMSAATTGAGHLLIAPDYIGLGQSYDRHPYLHAATTVSTTLDMLKASRTWLSAVGITWPEELFLMGFSQGGHAVFAVQRELERMEDPPFTVTASAPMAGAFQLRDVSFPQALTGMTDFHEFYLAYLTHAYSEIYGQPLNSVLLDSFAEAIPPMFDGEHSYDQIEAVLPELPTDMLTKEFLETYTAGGQHWFLDALAENDVFDWTPQAPVRIYYGENDVDVLPRDALETQAAMRKRGADVTAISVGAVDHVESALRAIPQVLAWFGELAAR